jgi:hypothetical protein
VGIVWAGLCLTVLAGCAGSQDDTVREVAEGFHDAVAAGDGAAACAVLAPTTRDELEQSTGKECRAAILEEDLPDVTGDGDPDVFGSMAEVAYAGDTVFLTRLPDGWRVLAAGCTPQPVGPHECLVKGA